MLIKLDPIEFAPILRITNPKTLNHPEKLQHIVRLRLIGIGLGERCGRCGGTGHYSYNPIHGTRCFGCSGGGIFPPPLTPVTYAKAVVAIKAGRLNAYLADLETRANDRKSPM